MADELVRTEGLVTDAERNTAKPDTTSPQQTDTTTTPAETAKVNWLEQPEFKEWQRKYETQRKEAQRKEQEMSARIAQYEAQLDRLATQGLDEPGKLQYENQKLRQMLNAMHQEKQVAEGKQRIYSMIRQKAGTHIPDEILEEAQDADDAWSRAVDYIIQRGTPQQAQQAKAEKKEANSVYLGGTPATLDDLDAKLQTAFKNGEIQEYMRLLRLSPKRG